MCASCRQPSSLPPRRQGSLLHAAFTPGDRRPGRAEGGGRPPALTRLKVTRGPDKETAKRHGGWRGKATARPTRSMGSAQRGGRPPPASPASRRGPRPLHVAESHVRPPAPRAARARCAHRLAQAASAQARGAPPPGAALPRCHLVAVTTFSA